MDTVTYPNNDVQQFLRDYFCPVRLDIHRAVAEVERRNVNRTPMLLVLDDHGMEQHRIVGYQRPKDFRAEAGLGLAKAAIAQKDWENAVAHLREVASHFSDTWTAPEAQYWLGVARYKGEGKPDGLTAEWSSLLDRWPDSPWARSASFIRE